MFGGQQSAGVAARCHKAAQAARLDLELEYRQVFLWYGLLEDGGQASVAPVILNRRGSIPWAFTRRPMVRSVSPS